MLEMRQAWEKAWDYLKDKLGNTTFEAWILPLRPKSKDKHAFILEAPDTFFRDWVDRHYRQIIQEALQWST
ncbi:MAG: hypothetical protein KKE91_01290, partial [Candidatus Omnitrophica bacterium]|nr:hypothetical protein [Candidatus Omnitrophota bacterium]